MRHRLRKMLEAPFFGRVDFIYDGEEEPEIFYIGIGNLDFQILSLFFIGKAHRFRFKLSRLFFNQINI